MFYFFALPFLGTDVFFSVFPQFVLSHLVLSSPLLLPPTLLFPFPVSLKKPGSLFYVFSVVIRLTSFSCKTAPLESVCFEFLDVHASGSLHPSSQLQITVQY
jgi:hypothetical protein